MQRCIQLTDTNSPCGLFFFKTSLIPCQLYILHISLVSIEKRVYPIPFRTRQSSSSSPMILHTLVWESRPMPRFSLERSSSDGLSSFKSPALPACFRCPGAGAFGVLDEGEACARENDIGFWSGGAYLLGEVFALPFIFFCHTVCLG